MFRIPQSKAGPYAWRAIAILFALSSLRQLAAVSEFGQLPSSFE